MSAIAIEYRKNPSYSPSVPAEPRLFAAIDLDTYGVNAEITDVPIYYQSWEEPIGPFEEAYSTRVAGLPLEQYSLENLESVLTKYLLALIRFGRFPEYVFYVGDSAWPIYRLPDQVVTRYPGSPVFSAPSVAELQVSLANHLKKIGYIKKLGELGILYFSQSDLQLYPPDCMLRLPKAADIPVYPTKKGDGKQLLMPQDSHSITAPVNHGAEILALYKEAGKHLMKKGWVADRYDMTVRKLTASTWIQMRETLDALGFALAYDAEFEGEIIHRQVPVFTDGDSLIAARATRRTHTALYFGPDIEFLQSRLGKELYHRGITSHLDDVYVTSAHC